MVVQANLIRGPVGGLTWSELQYVIGLRALGHDVYYLEEGDGYPSCYDPRSNEFGSDPTYGLEYAASVFDAVGLPDRWAYLDQERGWLGACRQRAVEILTSADVLISVGGLVAMMGEAFRRVPVRVYLDRDPVFTQIRHIADAELRERAESHTAFFTYGENLAHPGGLPDDGIRWQPTRQPVLLDSVPLTPGSEHGAFTTVMQWDSYPALEYGGERFGMKSESFGKILTLPNRVTTPLELAIGAPAQVRQELEASGWRIRDPRVPTRDPTTYLAYLRDSKAELSIAKHGYVVSKSGWFADRSVAYLACGRPVVLEDAGFTDWLPVGLGALAFRTADEAVSAIHDVEADYARHCAAARELAGEYFGAEKVLGALLEASVS